MMGYFPIFNETQVWLRVCVKHSMKNTLAKVVEFHQQSFGMRGLFTPTANETGCGLLIKLMQLSLTVRMSRIMPKVQDVFIPFWFQFGSLTALSGAQVQIFWNCKMFFSTLVLCLAASGEKVGEAVSVGAQSTPRLHLMAKIPSWDETAFSLLRAEFE